MLSVIDCILAAVAGLCDRMRGGFPDDRLFPGGKPWYMPGIVTSDWRLWLATGVAWKFGEQVAGDFGGTFRLVAGVPGWIFPLIRVGFMWPILVVPLVWFEPRLGLLVPASILGVILSAITAKWAPLPRGPWLQLHTAAPWQELLRGYFIGAFVIAGEALL